MGRYIPIKVRNTVNLTRYNLHWKDGHTYGFPKKRGMFQTLEKQIDIAQIIGIIGLRRTGKTVLLKQLIDHLIDLGQARDGIIYYSFDDEIVPLKEIFRDFASRSGSDLGETGRIYVFLDEIQKLDNWQNQIKYYYDTHPGVKFFISGSSSLFLRKKAEESLAGRIFLFHLPVLSFRDFLVLKGEEGLLKNPDMFKEEMMLQTEMYMRRQLPEIVTAKEDFIRMYTESIVNKIIYEDLPGVFPIEYGDALKRLMAIVANNPGIITDYNTLSNELGLSRKTLSNYVSYLERGFIIQKCYNFSRNRLTSEKKMKRLYLTNTTFILSMPDPTDLGRVVENLVINASGARFFWRHGNQEVDAVLEEEGGSILPVESKYKSNIPNKDIKGLLKFMGRFGLERGCVVTKDLEARKVISGHHIEYTPLWKWMLNVEV